jgi:hypothetical protein
MGIRPGHSHPAYTAAHGSSHASTQPSGHHPSSGRTPANRLPGAVLYGLLAWLSPIYICGAVLGFGATGTLVSPFLQGWLQLVTALAGAYVLCSFCIRPLLTGVQKWASLPAKTLSDAMLENGTAVTDFDSQGYGLVRLNLDGQVVQLLGQLAPDERGGDRVRSGETLFVRSVDPAKQRCIVCRTTGSILARY